MWLFEHSCAILNITTTGMMLSSPHGLKPHCATIDSILLGNFTLKFSSYALQYSTLRYLLEIDSLASQYSLRMHLHTDNPGFCEEQRCLIKAANWILIMLLNTFTTLKDCGQRKYIAKKIQTFLTKPTIHFEIVTAYKRDTFITCHVTLPYIFPKQLQHTRKK